MPDLTAGQIYGLGTTASNWANRVANALREQARMAENVGGETSRVHAARLQSVASELRTIGVDEPVHLLALAVMDARRAGGVTDDGYMYRPSESARKVINTLGKTQVFVPYDQFLLALFAGELRDVARAFSRSAVTLSDAQRRAEQAGNRAAQYRLNLERTSTTLASTEGELTQTRTRLAEAEAQVEFLTGQLEAGAVVQGGNGASAPTMVDADDRPSAELLEKVVLNPGSFHSVPGAKYVELRQHNGMPTYATRPTRDGKRETLWFAPEHTTTISRAVEWAADVRKGK
jgi:hypothetical protein